MAAISLELDGRCTQKSTQQIRVRITHRGTNTYICTGVYVEPQYFIRGSLYDPIHRDAPLAIQKREQVTQVVRKIDEWLIGTTKDELRNMTATDIRAHCGLRQSRVAAERKRENEYQRMIAESKKRGSKNDFVHFVSEYGYSRHTEKSQEGYAYCWRVLQQYCSDHGRLTIYFHEIDYSLLSDFASWLRMTGRGECTRNKLESYVRAAYREAQRRHLISREYDPYFDYSIKGVPEREIECMTATQVRALMEIELPTMSICRARDAAMMSFYLCGANLLDLYNLQRISYGEAVFVRHKVSGKTQRPLHIRIEPEMAVLIEKYKGDKDALHFRSLYPNYDTFRHKISHCLQEVSKILGFEVTMARIRRTWASIAGSLDISDRVIDKSMGHMDASVKNRYYERYDWSRTARANRMVIDAVLAETSEKG